MNKKVAISDFKGMLRKGGLKATKPRMAVLHLLARSKRPESPRAIVEAVPDIDQATVYRMLKMLEDARIVRRVDFGHTHAHYEILRDDDHHHLICISCGRSEDIHKCNADEMASAVLRGSKQFARIERHSLEFYGLCNACSKKAV
ncbi:MAG: Fur family transcriptional regulator [Patescibacteria group bacterium]